jgi:DNA-binding transcriptional LysR family regulator
MALLEQLRYFVAVAEELHFTRAAERLHIAQPGLSQQIKGLERMVGVPLFVRDKRSVELTPAGEALLNEARAIIEMSDRALTVARTAQDGKTGVLKIGTRILGWDEAVTGLIDGFRDAHPKVAIEFHPAVMGEGVINLEHRSVDVAFVVPLYEPTDTVQYLALGDFEPLIALPATHPLAALDRISPAAIAGETFLGPPQAFHPSVIAKLLEWLFGAEHVPTHRIDTPDLAGESRLQRVADGEGFTVTFTPGAKCFEIEGVVLRPFAEPVPKIAYGIAWLDDPISPFVRPFVESAEAWLAGVRRSVANTGAAAD